MSIRQLYRNPERCAGCPFRNECLLPSKKPEVSDDAEKICSRNEVLEQFHEYVDITLGSEFGKELKKQRSIQVEGAFGVIKELHEIHQIPKKRNERCNDGVSFSVSRLQSQEIPHVPTTSGEEERSEGMMIKKLFTVKK